MRKLKMEITLNPVALNRYLHPRRELYDGQKKAIAKVLECLHEWEFHDKIESVVLYGSCARKNMRPDSDVDILVTLTPSNISPDLKDRVLDLKGRFAFLGGLYAPVDMKVMFGNAWRTSDFTFYENVRREGVELWT